MKPYFLYLLFGFSGVALATNGCTTSKVEAAKTLEAVGLSAKATVDTAAILLKNGKISVIQFENVAYFYDNRFQPAFRAALILVENNQQAPASLKLVQLAAELSSLLAESK